MKRITDIVLSSILIILFLPIIIAIFLLIKITSKGPAIHTSKRIGLNNSVFNMPKFRTMKVETPDNIATHLMLNTNNYITPVGKFLRKTSLDELPQLITVLIGYMSLVGPRPALYNQYDLIDLRKKYNIHMFLPGITGWAQINGRDEISIEDKVKLDYYYCKNITIFLDIKILIFTVINIIKRKNIKH